ncbi:snRNA-activating protein complex subunit 2 [Notolabrus celidotus]|uniref:snRNA-activating protein complex subunit 2 n=1 Tax=Notolabrus celidotus TaxID=1203425 RepID=UPI00148FDF09|nr:snRNA-activating protein complex subunit 2 [Notolabrus celidotus]
MKPPPRKRSKPERTSLQTNLMRSGKWQRGELRRLLTGLKKLSGSGMEPGDPDYSALKGHVKTRSVTEIQSMVDSLKDRVISTVSYRYRRRKREERRVKKPVELWTHMASSVAGTLEETINTAFAQMLIVSSTEPRTLRNSDPPKVQAPNTDQSRPAGRTVPFRPMPRSAPAPGVSPGPVKRLPAPPQVVRVPNSKVSPPQTQPGTEPGAPSCQTAAVAPPHSGSQTTSGTPITGPITPASGGQITHKPSEQQTPLTSPPLPTPLPLSSPAATICARFGRTSKYATKDSPRVLGVKCVVDFERIYKYLSVILKPDEECHLTPMEGAIMLDLLMSLPEELPHLDCSKLSKHLNQVYQSLSSSSHSKMAKDLQDRLPPRTDSPAGPDTGTPNAQQNAAEPADKQSEEVTQQPHKAESQSSASNTPSNQDTEITGVCPPLNPFMVPLELLKRRVVQPLNE